MNRIIPAALVILALAAPCPAQPAKAVDLVPDDALGFLLIKDLRQLSDKVNNLAEKLKVEERVSLLELIQKEMGIREGLNDKGSVVFIVVKSRDEKLGIGAVVALPVANDEKMAKQLGVKSLGDTILPGEVGFGSGLLAGIGGKGPEGKPQKFPVLVAKRGDFVLLTIPGDKASLEAVLHAKTSVAAKIKPVQDWLDKQDMAGICTDNGVSTGLGMFLNGPGGGAETSTPGQFKQLQSTFAEVEKNVKFIAFGAQIENDGHARLATAVHFQPDGPYAKWITKAEALQEKLLDRLPEQPQFITALARISAQTTFETGAKFLFEQIAKDKAEALTKEWVKVVQQVSEVGVCIYADNNANGTLPLVPTISQLAAAPVVLLQVKDAAPFLDDTVDLMKHTTRAAQAASKTKAEINYEEKEIAGKPARLITVKDTAAAEKKNEKLEAQVFLLAALDSQLILAASLKEKSQAEAVIAKFSKQAGRSLATNAALKKSRSLLPDKLQVEVFLDLETFGILGLNSQAKTQVSGIAPLAFAMRTLPAGIEAQFVIPFDALKAVVDASMKKEKK